MTSIYIALVLVSGYLFAVISPKARYRYKRSDGWDAYFYVAACGVFFVACGWLLSSALSYYGFLHWLANIFGVDRESVARFVPVNDEAVSISTLKIAAWGITSIIISMMFGLLNKFRFMHPITRSNWLSEKTKSNPEESLLVYAASTRFPVIATLSSRKVYIGLVTMPALENGTIEHLELFPFLSGYRHKDELTLHLTTNYYEHYKRRSLASSKTPPDYLTLDDFRIVIPTSEIETISLFDRRTYNDFKQQEETDKLRGSMLD
ncbi:hypothetical protein [Aeromonas enteropelogenes]|uniref:hypothetical protein n=1 Tax=Aeromonas enteropelogenes TaxID=29489 RepID=UPI003B9DE3C0